MFDLSSHEYDSNSKKSDVLFVELASLKEQVPVKNIDREMVGLISVVLHLVDAHDLLDSLLTGLHESYSVLVLDGVRVHLGVGSKSSSDAWSKVSGISEERPLLFLADHSEVVALSEVSFNFEFSLVILHADCSFDVLSGKSFVLKGFLPSTEHNLGWIEGVLFFATSLARVLELI